MGKNCFSTRFHYQLICKHTPTVISQLTIFKRLTLILNLEGGGLTSLLSTSVKFVIGIIYCSNLKSWYINFVQITCSAANAFNSLL